MWELFPTASYLQQSCRICGSRFYYEVIDHGLVHALIIIAGGLDYCNIVFSLHNVVAWRRTLDVFAGICLFVCLFVGLCVCQHDNFRTTKHRMMKLGGRCIAQRSLPNSNVGS